MSWRRTLVAWLLIVVAESVHGTIRQLWIAPMMGDLPSRQLGVVVGSAIIFLVAWQPSVGSAPGRLESSSAWGWSGWR